MGASVMIIYSPESDTESSRIAALGSASYIAYIFLFGEPFGHALGQVLMRKLRNLSNMTVSCYTNLSSIFVFIIWASIAGQDLGVYQDFNTVDWLALISASILLVFA